VGGSPLIVIGAAIGIVLGHLYSYRRGGRTSRLHLAGLLVIFVAVTVLMRRDLWSVLSGATLPLAHLFLVGQALGSFQISSRMSIYRSLVLSALTIIIASGVALSTSYLISLAAFVVLAIATMASANLEEQKYGCTIVTCGRWFSPVPFWAGTTLSFLVLAGLLFWSFPRINIAANAAPGYLPSRMEVVSGLPTNLPSEPSASAEFMPTEGEDGEISQTAAQAQRDGQDAYNLDQAEEGKGAHESVGRSPRDSAEVVNLGYLGGGEAVVMNVRSPVASYWRGLILDKYDGVRWSSSPNHSPLPLDDIASTRAHESGKARYWQTYYIQGDGPIPLFTGYIPLGVLLPEGSVAVTGKESGAARFRLGGGLPYRALSQVPDFDLDELRRDVAFHQDPAYLQLPPIPARVLTLAKEVTRGAATDFDKAMRLEQFLLRSYRYGDDLQPLAPDDESTDSFLFKRKKGVCSQFASAMAVMARLVGLPARVAIGYRPGAYDLWSGTYRVRAGDAHAWVEIHFREHGWVPFDPTPAASQGEAGALPLPRWNGLLPWQHSQLGLPLTSPGSVALTRLVTFGGWGNIAPWPLVILGFVFILALIGALGLQGHRPASKHKDEPFCYSRLGDPQRIMAIKLFRKLENLLAKDGFRRRQTSETIAEYAGVASRFLPAKQEDMKWLAEVTARAAYDPQPMGEELVREAAQRVEAIARSLR
jgi:transglutaminase-like putative cysteine protease